ncbi:DsrH/TusB family sulfur metabolism protein [Moorella naiadis]|uniref:DsrH/TusB family sulfur metabolism protein n=1 Tax=Moorella naiadis (nom. illeg.) TaxID=3093670 RepID=UPI003D9C7CBF
MRLLILLGSAPDTVNARRAFNLAQHCAAAGDNVTVAMVQNGVLAGLKRPAGQDIFVGENNIEGLALDEDLELRGFTDEYLAPGVKSCSYEELVDRMMEQSGRVWGVF